MELFAVTPLLLLPNDEQLDDLSLAELPALLAAFRGEWVASTDFDRVGTYFGARRRTMSFFSSALTECKSSTIFSLSRSDSSSCVDFICATVFFSASES